MSHQSSIVPDFIKSLLEEENKISFLGEMEKQVSDVVSQVQGAVDSVSDTLGSLDFSPMALVPELDDALNASGLITAESSTAMFEWFNKNLVPLEEAGYEELIENAKEVAVMRNGALTTQYSQSVKMYWNIGERSVALYKYASKVESQDAVTYQAYLSSFESILFELGADELYLDTLGAASKGASYLAGSSDIFKTE
jgi:hypothetical protein